MTFDSHVHVFPYLGDANGYESADQHLADCQRLMQLIRAEPTQRVSDNSVVAERKLWDSSRPGLDGWVDRSFRVGEYGRFVWEQDGEECYLQFMPPSLKDMTSPPDLLLAMMARAGVSRAVIQCGSIYGRLNEQHAAMLRARPGLREVFFPLAQVHEDRASSAVEIDRFLGAIRDDRLRGLWYTTAEPRTFEPDYDVFWREVQETGVPVFFDFYPSWVEGVRRMARWRRRFPSIKVVLPQSFPTGLAAHPDDLVFDAELLAVLSEPNTWVELAFPIARGAVEAYPFSQSSRAIRQIHDVLGSERMIWGSDAPNVERYCTYTQSLEYLTTECDFLSAEDVYRITEENLAGVMGVEPLSEGIREP